MRRFTGELQCRESAWRNPQRRVQGRLHKGWLETAPSRRRGPRCMCPRAARAPVREPCSLLFLPDHQSERRVTPIRRRTGCTAESPALELRLKCPVEQRYSSMCEKCAPSSWSLIGCPQLWRNQNRKSSVAGRGPASAAYSPAARGNDGT